MSDSRKTQKKGVSSPFQGLVFGDGELSRDDVAKYLLANREVIRKRVLRKLRHAGIGGVDPDDVTSSVFRRIDAAMLRGVVRTSSEREFWAYVIAICDNATIARLRSGRRERGSAAVGETGASEGSPRWLSRRFAACADDNEAAEFLHRIVMSLASEDDRELLLWRLGGSPYRAIAAAMGRPQATLRVRWATICRELRERFAAAGGGGGTDRAASSAGDYRRGTRLGPEPPSRGTVHRIAMAALVTIWMPCGSIAPP